MEVEMVNTLAGIRACVGHDAVTRLTDPQFVGYLGTPQQDTPQQRLVTQVYLPERGDMLPRYHQRVNGGLRVYVLECHHRLIFEDDLSPHKLLRHFAKYTVIYVALVGHVLTSLLGIRDW